MASKGFRRRIERHPVASFFVLTYATSWLALLPAMLGYRVDLNQLLSMIAQFGPALAVLVQVATLSVVVVALIAATRGTLGYGSTPMRDTGAARSETKR